jgi:hypothetical protein
MAKAEIHFGLKPIPIIYSFSALKGGAIKYLDYNIYCTIYCIIKAEKRFVAEPSLDPEKIGTRGLSSSCRHRRTLKYQSICGGTTTDSKGAMLING